MNAVYIVELTNDERKALVELTRRGETKARTLKRAQILLAADRGETDAAIASSVSTSTSTVFRTRRKFLIGGVDHALSEAPRPGAERKLKPHHEAMLTALACTTPPKGRARWTLQLLAGRLVRLTDLKKISKETVRRRLADNQLKPWLRKMWCIPKVDAEYVARMEGILDLYAEPYDPNRPLVCFDETPIQLLDETRRPRPPRPGRPRQIDYEYRRMGTANLFVTFDPNRRWRRVKTTEHRRKQDFARCMKELVDKHYPNADVIRVVMDNLSTHKPASLYETFPAAEARRILRRLEFHFTPKHASWLNMVEIEIGVLSSQCLDRRIPSIAVLRSETRAWERQRNTEKASIKWLFTIDKAREKLGSAYPKI